MATAIYRKSSNEVHKISLIDQVWPEMDATIWGVAMDPNLPDGSDVREVLGSGRLGNLRVLGYAKIYEPGTNTVRNATQVEIDGFEALYLEDESIEDASAAADLLVQHPLFRKLLTAFADILKDEINILRSQHGLAPRTLAQLKTALALLD